MSSETNTTVCELEAAFEKAEQQQEIVYSVEEDKAYEQHKQQKNDLKL